MFTPDDASAGAPLEAEPLESADATALPSAVACASVSAALDKVKRPPAVRLRAPMRVACEIVFARLIAIAAATLTPPELVEALGVCVAPVPLPPFDEDVASAKLRSFATASSTPEPA